MKRIVNLVAGRLSKNIRPLPVSVTDSNSLAESETIRNQYYIEALERFSHSEEGRRLSQEIENMRPPIRNLGGVKICHFVHFLVKFSI